MFHCTQFAVQRANFPFNLQLSRSFSNCFPAGVYNNSIKPLLQLQYCTREHGYTKLQREKFSLAR